MPKWNNWSGWVEANPSAIEYPDNEAALIKIMAQAKGPIRVVGTGHSFTPLAATDGTLIDLCKLTGFIDLDHEKREATFWGGTPIHQVGRELHARGFGLINQGDIDRQTLAGAVSTGTHGTGIDLGSFSTMVRAVRLVTSSGEVIDASPSKNNDMFEAARLSLGALGVLSHITIAVEPAYKLVERGWTMPIMDCFNAIEALRTATRHFEFFWFPYADDVICKSLDATNEPARPIRDHDQGEMRDPEEDRVRGMFDLTARFPFLSGPVTRHITREAGKGKVQRHAKAGGSVRWSHEAFPSPRNIKFNEMEWAVPAEAGIDVMREIAAYIRQKSIRVAFPLEFRFVAADEVWLSPFNGRDSVTIAVHQFHKQDYEEFFDHCETIFRSYEGRPHWGKLHRATEPDFAMMYPDWPYFQTVRRMLDPQGKMLNDHLATLFGEAAFVGS